MARRTPDLTDKQEGVLLLIGEGKSDAEIGDDLGLTVHGASYHVRTLRRKFGVSHKRELIRAARNYFLRQQITGKR